MGDNNRMIICSSDRHRKPGEEHPLYLRFLDYVMAQKPQYWIKLGDTNELAWFSFHTIYGDPISREEIEREREIARVITEIEVPGNHDWDIAKYQNYLKPIIIAAPKFQMDGIEYSHWHEFDPLTEHVWDPLTRNRCVKAHLPRLYTRLYGTPGYVAFVDKQKYQTLIELYHEHYEKLVMEDGISRPGGHTHYPFVDGKPNGRWVGNCGSAGVMSWLEITDWGWRVRCIDELN